MKKVIRNNIIALLIASFILPLISCSKPYSKGDILCEYDALNCLYYVKTEIKKYKYSDYIFDDVSNGIYKKNTPSLADYKLSKAALDYDIPAYVQARMDYAIKTDLIDKYAIRMDGVCAAVHDDYFEQKNSYIHFYDKSQNKDTLLYDGTATNISYDDEVPSISFDIEYEDNFSDEYEGRRMMLSDIIASNTTIEGYMRVILGRGKERRKYFMDRRVDDSQIYDIATMSNVATR